MKLRVMGAVVVAAVAVTGLSGCDSKVGTAAVVNGDRISDSDVGTYVTRQAVPFDAGDGTQITPKSFALQTWIVTQAFEQAIDKNGGAITDAERTEYQSLALSGSTPAKAAAPYTAKGFTAAMGALATEEQANFLLLAHRLDPDADQTKLQQDLQGALRTKVIGELNKVTDQVSVSGRYGTWDAKTLSIDSGDGAGLPGFVTFDATQ